MPILVLCAALFAAAQPRHLTSLFRAADAKGAALALDVATGEVVASASAGREVGAELLPLSTIKLSLAAVWWDRGLAGSLDDMLVEGRDQPGKDRAVALRKRIGGTQVLRDVRRYGLDSLTLAADAGTGPARAKPYDGWFAGLVFDEREPRYTVAVYVDGGGPGGGIAASIAAGMARILSQQLPVDRR